MHATVVGAVVEPCASKCIGTFTWIHNLSYGECRGRQKGKNKSIVSSICAGKRTGPLSGRVFNFKIFSFFFSLRAKDDKRKRKCRTFAICYLTKVDVTTTNVHQSTAGRIKKISIRFHDQARNGTFSILSHKETHTRPTLQF